MHYMDEECLVNYKAGGMKFADIHSFDRWISKKENYERILPAPRAIVAFRVRHNQREWSGIGNFINFWHEGEYEARLKRHRDIQAHNDSRPNQGYGDGTHKHSSFSPHNWHPFNKSSVYFDEMTKGVRDEITKHNRIVLVLQGLLDRSLALHPHPAWQLWTPAGFAAALRLVYDDSRTLVPGPKPDFEAYRKRLNATLGVGSITVGQHAFWYAREVERFKNDNRRSHYYSDGRERTPDLYGNPGPKDLARIEEIQVKRGGERLFKFSWEREKHWKTLQRERNAYFRSDTVKETYTCSIWVPESKLFNVTAYTPGDFHQFFDDPRTRAEYLKWATYLLTSEDWHSGKVKLERMNTELSDPEAESDDE